MYMTELHQSKYLAELHQPKYLVELHHFCINMSSARYFDYNVYTEMMKFCQGF
jgi:hypothetical protein